MSITRVDQLFALLLIGLGGYIVWKGLDYGYMNGTTPGGGFFPILIGGGLAVLSAANLMRGLLGREKLANALTPRDLGKIALLFVALAGVVVLTPYLGLALTAMAFMLAVGLIIRPTLAPAFLVRLVPCAVLFPLFLRLAFGEWLKIPVPTGPFGL